MVEKTSYYLSSKAPEMENAMHTRLVCSITNCSKTDAAQEGLGFRVFRSSDPKPRTGILRVHDGFFSEATMTWLKRCGPRA